MRRYFPSGILVAIGLIASISFYESGNIVAGIAIMFGSIVATIAIEAYILH